MPYSSWPPIQIRLFVEYGITHCVGDMIRVWSLLNKISVALERFQWDHQFIWEIFVKGTSCCKWIMMSTEQCPIVAASEPPLCWQLNCMYLGSSGKKTCVDSLEHCASSLHQGRVLSPDALCKYSCSHPDVFFCFCWSAVRTLDLVKD